MDISPIAEERFGSTRWIKWAVDQPTIAVLSLLLNRNRTSSEAAHVNTELNMVRDGVSVLTVILHRLKSVLY